MITRNTPSTTAHMAPDRDAPVLPRNRAKRQATIAQSIAENLPSVDEMHRNLDNVLAEATPEEWAEGILWYHMARLEADRATKVAAAKGRKLTRRAAVGVAASLSPQLSWTQNVVLLRRAAKAGKASGQVGNATAKADRILAGENPRDVLGGPKVRSFDRNIADPEHPGAVTVDRHCLDMLTNERGYTADKPLDRPGVYQIAAAVVRRKAREVGLAPCQVQAVAWIVWRRLHGVVV